MATVGHLYAGLGLRLNLRPHENKMELVKAPEEGAMISYPWPLVSDTFQRTTFHLAAILTNKDSILTLEEPEAHAFPYYTNYLAELIALDDRQNQYFVTTHNPYFLLPLVAKVSSVRHSTTIICA